MLLTVLPLVATSDCPSAQVILHGPGTEVVPLLVSSEASCEQHACQKNFVSFIFSAFTIVVATGDGIASCSSDP